MEINSAQEKKDFLGMHINEMDVAQLGRLRNYVNNDDTFRQQWRNSNPNLKINKQTDTDDGGLATRDEVMSGKFDKKLMKDFEEIGELQAELLMRGGHKEQASIERRGVWLRYRQLLATASPNQLGETGQNIQLMLFNEDPSFRKAYQKSDGSLIKE